MAGQNVSESPPPFSKSLSQPEPVPEAGVRRALELMQSGQLFRYGERGGELSEVSLLERELADYLGVPYVCGVNSGGSALFLALKAVGVEAGEPVLVNAFTLAPVPSAITHAAATPVMVEITEDYVIDPEDLRRRAAESGARVLLLSYMRGNVPDMSAVLRVCHDLELTLIEDCAHTLGATWRGRHLGTLGAAGCYSAQTFKHLNSGEGGFLGCSDPELAAKVVLMSGSYMLFAQNGARPPETIFERFKALTPNFSMRMSALSGAVLRPQLRLLSERAKTWNAAYDAVSAALRGVSGLRLPTRQPDVRYVPSSLQFSLEGTADELGAFQRRCETRGVFLKWFGAPQAQGFTSTYRHWQYVGGPDLGRTDAVMRGLFDVRLPLHLTPADCLLIAEIITSAVTPLAERNSTP